MSRTKTLTTEYKDTKIVFDLTTKKFSVDTYDLKGEYDTIEDAEKAIREWLKPEIAEVKKEVVKVLVKRYGDYKEATTRFAEKTGGYGETEYWVTYTKKEYGYGSANKGAVRLYNIILDTPENRAAIKAIEAKEKEKEQAEKAFDKEIEKLEKAIKPATLPKTE